MAPSPERIRAFVMAAHGDLEQVRALLEETPALLHLAYEWRPGDQESAIQAAAHTGQRAIALYLLARGAPLSSPTAAMLGLEQSLRAMLQADPRQAQARGAHSIPLLPHAALSGREALVALVYEYGAREGSGLALGLAAQRGYLEVVRWLLAKAQPDLSWTNPQGKTALTLALEGGHSAIAELLRRYGL